MGTHRNPTQDRTATGTTLHNRYPFVIVIIIIIVIIVIIIIIVIIVIIVIISAFSECFKPSFITGGHE